MQATIVDLFTTVPGRGNPGAVVLDAGALSGPEMAAIAAKLGLLTTFVDGTRLRYYQPSGVARTLSCHGTLAALSVLSQTADRTGTFRLCTPAGDLPVDVKLGLYGLRLEPVSFREPVDPGLAAEALGLEVAEIDGPVEPGGTDRPKLLVPIPSVEALDRLHPATGRVEAACEATQSTGIYAFTCKARTGGVAADARHFSAGAGSGEDPVTGVAGVALAWYLWRHGVLPGCATVQIEQGHAMGRPGRMLIKQEPGSGFRTWLYGQAVLERQVDV